jgi:hypothetical protein
MAAFTRKTVLGTMMQRKDVMAVVDEFVPGASKNPKLMLARGMTLEQVSKIPIAKLSSETLDALLVALNEKFPG